MNYQNIYNNLIINAKSEYRIKYNGTYYEKHHILPKCLGGDNSFNNLVLLTAKEHYIAHKLLILIYPKNKGLIFAFWRLSSDCSLKRVS